MSQPLAFGEVLDAVCALSTDEQLTLLELVGRRLAEEGRIRVAASIRDARREYAEGKCRSATVDELMSEILS
jgi:hypothetical protein